MASFPLPARLAGLGGMFRLHLSHDIPRDYRSSYATPEARRHMTDIHAALLTRGVLLTPNCSGALSTPMGEAEMTLLSTALFAAVSQVLRAG